MAIANIFPQQIKNISILGLVIVLTSCGGGGSSSSNPVISSSTAISSSSIVSNSFSASSVASIDSSSASSDSVSSSTSSVSDTTPDAFTFTAVTGAAFASVNVSNTITLSGFDSPVAITIVGGEYKIDSGTYTTAAGTVSANHTITLRTTAASALNTAVNAVVTIGGVAGTYTVTTIADTVAPSAQIIFPTAVSLSNGSTLIVRGTAHDDYSIASVTVNGVAAASTDNFTTWTASVPLSTGVNTLTVVATDGSGNTNNNAANVSVQRVASLSSAHTPDANNLFAATNFFTIDTVNNRGLLTDNSLNAVIAVDLSTGARTLFSTATIPTSTLPFSSPYGIALDPDRNRALVVDFTLQAIIAVDLTTGARTLFSNSSTPDANHPFVKPSGIVLDIDSTHNRNRAIVADSDTNTLFAVDLITGARTILSDATTPDTNNSFSGAQFGLYGITVDALHNRALLSDLNLKAVFAVDLTTGARTIMSSNTIPNATNLFDLPLCIAVDLANNRMLVTDFTLNAIVAVSLPSGARTILSSPSVPNANTSLINPTDISLDSVKNIAYVIDPYPATAISVVDITTGERVILSK